jgi:hypothetical protein
LYDKKVAIPRGDILPDPSGHSLNLRPQLVLNLKEAEEDKDVPEALQHLNSVMFCLPH